LGHLVSDFIVALGDRNVPRLKHVAGRFVLLVGKAIALRLAVDLLERAVSVLSFVFSLSLGTWAD